MTKAKIKEHLEHDSYCQDCQKKAGGINPKDQNDVTMSLGICKSCGEVKSIVPNDDYNWPGVKGAWFD